MQTVTEKISKIRILNETDLGEIAPFQIIDEKGELAQEYNIDVPLAKNMYETMVFTRVFDEKTINLSTLREVGVYAPHSGQEAAQVGSVFALGKKDWLVPMYRDNAAMIAKGMPVDMILQHLSGDEFGMQIPEDVHMLPFSISVGTQIPHAAGLAYAQKIRKTGSIVYVSTGEGGTSKADFHEGLNFAAAEGVPLVVGVQNNQYAISTPNRKETGSRTFAQKAVAYGVEGILVDGNDVFAVYEATKYAAQRARLLSKPTLIEFITYRYRMHTTAELVSAKKRKQEEVDTWKLKDPLIRLESFLMKNGIVNDGYKQDVLLRAQERMRESIALFRAKPAPDPQDIFRYMYSEMTPRLSEQLEEAFGTKEGENVSTTVASQAWGLPKGNGPQLNMRNSLNSALHQIMQEDERLVVYGEDVGFNGGVFQVTKGLQERFGEERVFDSPLAELSIAGVFVGLSIGGLIPIAEIQFDGFAPPTLDQIITHISRLRNRSRGRYKIQGVIRFPFGGGVSGLEHHSDSPEVYFAATPGIKVVVPSNPYDAKGLLITSVKDGNPVIFMEPKKLYDAPKIEVPEEEFEIPLGKANVLKEGSDVTIVTYGYMVYPTLEASSKYSVDVIDLRTLSPIDMATVRKSVEKTGRLVIVHEAQRMCGIGAEIAASIADSQLFSLKAPIKRVTGYDITPPLGKLERYYLPDSFRISKSIEEVMSY